MLPMVPREIPVQPWEDIGIEPDLQLAPGIAADDSIREKLATAEEQGYLACGHYRLIRQYPVSEECAFVVREMAVNQDRAGSAVRKQRRGIFVLAKRVVAISEIGVGQNVEGSFDVGKVPTLRVAYLELERTHPPSEPELIERCCIRHAEKPVKRLWLFPIKQVEVASESSFGQEYGFGPLLTVWEFRADKGLSVLAGFGETDVSDGRVQKLLVSPTRRVLNQDFGARP